MLTHTLSTAFGESELEVEYSWDDELPVDVIVFCAGGADITDLVSRTVMNKIEEQIYEKYGEDMAAEDEYLRDRAAEMAAEW